MEVGTKLLLTTQLEHLTYNGVVVQVDESRVWVRWQPVRDGIEEDFLNAMDYSLRGFVELFKGRLTILRKITKNLEDLL